MTIMVKVSREDSVNGVVDIQVLHQVTKGLWPFFDPQWEPAVTYSLLEPASSITVPVYEGQKLLIQERPVDSHAA